jgi:hypothetical protein
MNNKFVKICYKILNTLVVTEPDDGMRLRPPVRGRRFRDKVKALPYPVSISAQVVEPSPS